MTNKTITTNVNEDYLPSPWL